MRGRRRRATGAEGRDRGRRGRGGSREETGPEVEGEQTLPVVVLVKLFKIVGEMKCFNFDTSFQAFRRLLLRLAEREASQRGTTAA